MKKLFLTLVTVCLLGCSNLTPFKAYQAPQDNFNPNVLHYFSGGIFYQENEFGGPGVGRFYLNTFDKDNVLTWTITTDWLSSSIGGAKWLFNNTIAFNIDGKIYKFNGHAIPNTSVTGFGVIEKNSYSVSNEFIDKLSQANSVIIRVSGTQNYVERILTVEDIKNIKWYISYIKAGNRPAIAN